MPNITTLRWDLKFRPAAQRIYRSLTPIDISSPPAPLATLATDAREYVDLTALDETVYYYALAQDNSESPVQTAWALVTITTPEAAAGPPPPPAPTDFRYWRIFDGNHEFPFINEIEFRSSIAGSDWTNISGAVIAGFAGFGGNDAIDAFDDNAGTYWQCQSTVPSTSWIGWDLGAGNADTVEEVVITSTSGATKDRFYYGMIQHSEDGITWTPWGLFGNVTPLGKTTTTFAPDKDAVGELGARDETFRYWEVLAWGRGNRGDWFQGYRELDFLAADLTTSLNKTLGGTASSNDSRNPAANPWNNINWETNNVTRMIWNRWDFGAGNETACYGLKVKAANNGSVTPCAAIVRASNDLSTWKYFYVWDSLTWTNNQVRTFTF